MTHSSHTRRPTDVFFFKEVAYFNVAILNAVFGSPQPSKTQREKPAIYNQELTFKLSLMNTTMV